MLSAIIMTLIISSTQFAVSIHDKQTIASPDNDLKYQLYLQSIIRDANGQLLSVSESTIGWVVIPTFQDGVQIPNLIDFFIDNNTTVEKNVIIIDNIKYEKIQFQTETVIDNTVLTNLGAAKVGMFGGTVWQFCGDFKGKYGLQCVPLLEARTPQIHIADGNVVTNQWTILRAMN